MSRRYKDERYESTATCLKECARDKNFLPNITDIFFPFPLFFILFFFIISHFRSLMRQVFIENDYRLASGQRIFPPPPRPIRFVPSNRFTSKSTKLWECTIRKNLSLEVIWNSLFHASPRLRWMFRYIKKSRWMERGEINKFHFHSWKTIGHWYMLRFNR